MSRGYGRGEGMFGRTDLLYREIDKRIKAETETSEDEQVWVLFDGVTKKVIDHLDKSDVESWDVETWRTFQRLLNVRPKQDKDVSPQLRTMSIDQLKKLATPKS